jgi:hypothetical protein
MIRDGICVTRVSKRQVLRPANPLSDPDQFAECGNSLLMSPQRPICRPEFAVYVILRREMVGICDGPRRQQVPGSIQRSIQVQILHRPIEQHPRTVARICGGRMAGQEIRVESDRISPLAATNEHFTLADQCVHPQATTYRFARTDASRGIKQTLRGGSRIVLVQELPAGGLKCRRLIQTDRVVVQAATHQKDGERSDREHAGTGGMKAGCAYTTDQ